jgi:hypothetical protein
MNKIGINYEHLAIDTMHTSVPLFYVCHLNRSRDIKYSVTQTVIPSISKSEDLID